MATTNNRRLTLTQSGANVKIDVKYNAVFSAFEHRLVGLGLRFRERIAVIGVDPPGATTGTVLTNFPVEFIEVTGDIAQPPILRHRTVTVPRALLDEDQNPVLVDPDEIRCRIRIEAIGFPPGVTPDAFTDQEVLGEGISQP